MDGYDDLGGRKETRTLAALRGICNHPRTPTPEPRLGSVGKTQNKKELETPFWVASPALREKPVLRTGEPRLGFTYARYVCA